MIRFIKALVLSLLLIFLPAWTQVGFNFRATDTYVTDNANEVYVLGDAYPTTRGGVTFGWLASLGDGTRDRDNTLDVRIAGINKVTNSGTPISFQVDGLNISATYTVCLALGDGGGGGAQAYQMIEVLDNTTSRFTITDTDGTAAVHFDDAMGTDFTGAAWPAGNVCQTGVSFSSGTMIFKLGSTTAQSNESTIAHFYLEEETGGGGSSLPLLLHAIGEY